MHPKSLRCFCIIAILLPAITSGVLAAEAETAADFQALYQTGTEARLAGDFDEAAEYLEQALELSPGNADVLLQLGLIHGYREDYAEGERLLLRAVEEAPGYTDAWLALARVRYWDGRRTAAREALDEALALAPENEEVLQLRDQLETAGPDSRAHEPDHRWRLDSSISYSRLARTDLDPWRETTHQLGYRLDSDTTLTGRMELSERFEEVDSYFQAGVQHSFGQAGDVYLNAGVTPEADFRQDWDVGLGGSLNLHDGVSDFGPLFLTFDGRHARYSDDAFQTASPGLQLYLFEGRAWVSGRWINNFKSLSDHEQGWLARGDVQVSDRLRVFAGMADAPETSEGVTYDVQSYFGGVVYDLNERLSLNLNYLHEDRRDSYLRRALTAGVTLRF
ncbi:YaiO family outer membrane beta-barrel protein [Fodinicurvata halophila]|uniref:YaiO family outer membrane beta-barrel protein n=1 Tax=Fodinicurvata halophila TaxID=1419723 RepID=UPI003640E2F1